MIPSTWNEVTYTRLFRNSTYIIQIARGKKPSISVDGTVLKGNLLPDFQDHGAHHVMVTII
jgi:cellobiose phosphorylase